jgi:transcriptional regulator with XRE-family HTH domain
MSTSTRPDRPVGDLVREWRQRRGVSQLRLALDADLSARHLSFVETGRAQPSRDVVLRLAEHLNVPLRQRNTMLLAAGFAPAFGERSLDDPDLATVRRLIEQLLRAHEPYPAVAVDRRWNIVSANSAVMPILSGVAPELAQPPVNVMRLALHPQGLAPRILNFAEWRGHLLERLAHQIDATADADLMELDRELRSYPASQVGTSRAVSGDSRVLVPLRLTTPLGTLNLVSTTMVFGTPLDVTLSEIAIETLLPADSETADRLRAMSVADR